MTEQSIRRTFGLAAHRLHRSTADGGLAEWVRLSESAIRELGLGIAAVGGSADALEKLDLLRGYGGLSRLPYGRAMYVVTVDSNGVMKSIEQRMTYANFTKVVANTWTKKEVSELLGPPGKQGRFDRNHRDWWEYRYLLFPDYRVVWVQFSDDGVVREVYDMVDPDEDRKKDGPSFN